MKTIAIAALMIGLLTSTAFAELVELGNDDLGRKLIYSTGLDITWLDYSHGPGNWYTIVAWAEALEVTFDGQTYTDWRLPMTVDGSYATLHWDGSGYSGWNITTSDLGFLYYAELGNPGSRAVDGSLTGCSPTCLMNTGPFTNLLLGRYWSTDHAGIDYYAWYFGTDSGGQYVDTKVNSFYGIAVHDGQLGGTVPTTETTFGAVKAMYR